MLIKLKLKGKVLLQILSIVILIFSFVGVFVGISNRVVATKNAHVYTKLETKGNAEKLKAVFERHFGYLHFFSETVAAHYKNDTNASFSLFESIMVDQATKNKDYSSVWALMNDKYYTDRGEGTNGWILIEGESKTNVINYQNTISAFNERFGEITNSGTDVFAKPFLLGGEYFVSIASPVKIMGSTIGYVGITLSQSFFEEYIQKNGVYEGGFLTVLANDGTFLGHRNSKFIGKTFAENFPVEAEIYTVDENVSKGKSFDMSTDFNRETYYSYFVPLYISNCAKPMSVEVTLPMSSLLTDANKSIYRSVVAAFFLLTILVLVIFLITNRIISPIGKVTKVLQLLSKGNTKNIYDIDIKTNDELQEMGDSLNKVVSGLRTTESFANQIGEGNLNQEYTLLGESDQLGKALLAMQLGLQSSKKEEEKRKEEEEIRNWTNKGIAKFGEILRNDSDNLTTLGFNAMSNLVEYLKVNQAALFVLSNNDEEESEPVFELVNAIAYGRDKFIKKEIRIGEGLVGRCAFEKKTIFLTDVPQDYHEITSGLGTANPNCVLIVPCILNDEVYSVIELASFTPLKKHEIEFVEQLAESIASTISNARTNLTTQQLLRTSQSKSEEMAAQEEELRQNLEEMEATQEDLKRQMTENAVMRLDLSKQNALLDSLLSSIPDYIYFKDAESKFIRVSNSMLALFNATSVEEVIGKSDFDFQSAEAAREYYNEEQEIMATLKGFSDKIQKEVLVDGTEQWMSVSKLPLVDENGVAIGTFGISKNITELKRLEQEAIAKNKK